VAVTRGLLEIMNREELEGVLAHELSHVLNRDILIGSVAATLAGAISMIANMLHWGAMFGGFGGGGNDRRGSNPIAMIATIIFAPLAAMLIQMAVSRSREYEADHTGAELAGSPYGLARALEKLGQANKRIPMNATPATSHLFIVAPLTGRSLANLFSTHPPLEERIRRLLQPR
jgi:heat shock protein HtpX